jgi:hypothetical protein
MTEWKLKVLGVLTILVIILFLHVKLFRFSEVVYQGALKTLVCLGRVTIVDTSEEADQILTFQLISGEFRGKSVQVKNIWTGRAFGDRVLRKGDVLFLEIPLRYQNQTAIEDVRMLEYFRTPFFDLPCRLIRLLDDFGRWHEGVTGNPDTLCYGICCSLRLSSPDD